jgi:hypothetical protein
MMSWILDLHWALLAIVTVGVFTLVGLVGLGFTRRFLLPRLPHGSYHDEVPATVLHGILIIYGLAVALLAIAVWEKYAEVTKAVSNEAVSVGTLYRDCGGYPEPTRSRMRDMLKEYTHQIIYEAWPLQKRGVIPSAGVEFMNQFQSVLMPFEPVTESQKALHLETLRSFDQLNEARRLRLDFVSSALPAPMWAVVLLGALITLTPAFFFRIESLAMHRLMVTLLSSIMGLLIFLMAFYDRPLNGRNSVSPEAYELIYHQLMETPSWGDAHR